MTNQRANVAGKLTEQRIEDLAKPGIYGDGGTLFLRVRDGGSRHWVQIVRVNGKRLERGLGGWPVVLLDEARAVAIENRRKIRRGEDPWADRHRAKVTLAAAKAEAKERAAPTFEQALDAVIAIQRPSWRSPKSEKQWRSSLTAYAGPLLRMRVSKIEAGHVLPLLEPIWTTKRETATRVKQRISAVLQWAVAQGHRSDNPVGALAAVLPRKRPAKVHRQALPHAQVAAAVESVRNSNAHLATKLAFELLVLTAARSREVREAQWPEVDLDAQLWTIPADRMKAARPHVVPLSPPALCVLARAADEYGRAGLIFPSLTGRALSDNTLSKLLRDRSIEAVPHGFRSSFRDWCAEQDCPRDIAEAALAHTVRDAVEAAYHRTKYLEQRRAWMNRWAAYCRP